MGLPLRLISTIAWQCEVAMAESRHLWGEIDPTLAHKSYHPARAARPGPPGRDGLRRGDRGNGVPREDGECEHWLSGHASKLGCRP
jgi:hypothetical protein